MNAESPGGDAGATAHKRLRLFVLSDVRVYREALVSSLRAHERLTPVGDSDCAQAAAQIHELRPDIVVLDAAVLANPDTARTILAMAPQAKTVAIGVSEADHAVLSCAAAGVSGFAPREASCEQLIAIIEGVTRNELVCSPRIAASIFHRLSAYCGRQPRPGSLTRRELQIIDLVDKGCSNKEISRQLRIGTATVKNHVHNILEKLEVRRRGEAAARMRREIVGLARDQSRPH